VGFLLFFLECACLCALIKGCRQLVLIGDHKQLAPVVISKKAAYKGMGVSFYERLMATLKITPFMLKTQYRMHPSICCFPSERIYNSQLYSSQSTEDFVLPSGFDWPNRSIHVAFVNVTDGKELHSKGETSCYNVEEIALITEIVYNLVKAPDNIWTSANDFGIITAYSAQKVYLRSAMLKIDKQRKDHLQLKNDYFEYSKIDVNTVDGFQGKQKEVILFSTVRSNGRVKLYFPKHLIYREILGFY
jgi:superfamily I DNA and/or RNA helicase